MASRQKSSQGEPSRRGDGSDHRAGLEPVVRRLLIDAVTAEIAGTFTDEGIPCILLKGPALVRWLYPPGQGRSYTDCDLLVRSEDVSAAERILTGMGFERAGLETIPGDRPRHAYSWTRRDGAVVDLHHTIPGARVPPEEVWNLLQPHLESMSLSGGSVDILDESGRALLVALHALKDGRRIRQARQDLALALERVPIEVWAEAARLGTEMGAVDAFAAGLQREPSGAEVADRLGLPGYRSPAVALRADRDPPLAEGMEWLFGTPGWRRKPVLVLRKLFPPATFMKDWTPIARRGPFGLAAAYAWRPLWVLWHTAPALRAWIRARRGSGGRPDPP
jgi:Uncharacterised nucleotidyltransferase